MKMPADRQLSSMLPTIFRVIIFVSTVTFATIVDDRPATRRISIAKSTTNHGASVKHLSADELRYTFGVTSHDDVPEHQQFVPDAHFHADGHLHRLMIELERQSHELHFEPTLHQLVDPNMVTVYRNSAEGAGRLLVDSRPKDCHYHHKSNHTYAAISTCDGNLKGIILKPSATFVIHPMPENSRTKRSSSSSGLHTHVIYKRSPETAPDDFCGIQSTFSSGELIEDESAVLEDVYVVGRRLTQQSDLVVELALFVDQQLWDHFVQKYGGSASDKLQDYAVTSLNNIQIMYHQPTAVPPLTFRIIRYEVMTSQPSALASHLHSNGHAQQYLNTFCQYQRGLSGRDWDHAFMLTGFDLHRGASRTISGIARLDGMCDPFNTCTLAEGLDFTSAFIGTHELGHSVGMRHDEPACASKHIMSSSLGPGKVTWSTCSLRDYHTFLEHLDNRNKNCLRESRLSERLRFNSVSQPGQQYDAHRQCQLMHGPSYQQISPRQDHYDGVCYMMWCGQSKFGRIITSHPALEGTFCEEHKWCQLGRCVPWTGGNAPAPAQQQPAPTLPPAPAPTPTPYSQPSRINGGWSAWSTLSCSACHCTHLVGSLGIARLSRTCSNPWPSNGGAECGGSSDFAVVCNDRCAWQTQSVDSYIAEKCSEHRRLKNDDELTGTGSQLTRYPQRACKVFCDVKNAVGSQRNYRFFGDNLPDGTPCGTRLPSDRFCLQGDCVPLACNGHALIGRDLECPSTTCPLAASTPTPTPTPTAHSHQWNAWSGWSSCSLTCGSGTMHRSRTCPTGSQCVGDANEYTSCSLAVCHAWLGAGSNSNLPSWTEWTDWNACSASCDQGSQARYRRCTSATGGWSSIAASNCGGEDMQVRPCTMGPCSGAIWGDWSIWSACSSSCGPGTKVRTRACALEPCDGSSSERMTCNERECSDAGGSSASVWYPWTEWSGCSRTCAGGTRTRDRRCIDHTCYGSSREQQACNQQSCYIDRLDVWTAWSTWSTCTSSCGTNGLRRRSRTCADNSNRCVGQSEETSACVEQLPSCANWGGWGYWSSCSETCGVGNRKRVRKCYGDGDCVGESFERENCQLQKWCSR